MVDGYDQFELRLPRADENLCHYCVHGYKGCWRKCSMKAIFEEPEEGDR